MRHQSTPQQQIKAKEITIRLKDIEIYNAKSNNLKNKGRINPSKTEH